MNERFEHRNGLSCSEIEDELDDANEGITEQAMWKLAALDRAEAAEALAERLREELVELTVQRDDLQRELRRAQATGDDRA